MSAFAEFESFDFSKIAAENKAYLDAACRKLDKKIETKGFFTEKDVREALA